MLSDLDLGVLRAVPDDYFVPASNVMRKSRILVGKHLKMFSVLRRLESLGFVERKSDEIPLEWKRTMPGTMVAS